jgi:DNA modification methylase
MKEANKAEHSGLEALASLSWDFHGAQTDYLTHGIHPYPAKYIPQIPHNLIQELSTRGERVADIFCGSGTTLVEALALGRNAIGVDANPLACLISRAKTSRLGAEDAECLEALVKRAAEVSRSVARVPNSLFEYEPFISKAPRPEHAEDKFLEFWFEPFVVEELAEVLGWCRTLSSEVAHTLALTAFSSIVVNVSKQDSDTRYVRREKTIAPGDTFKRFAKALEDTVRRSQEFTRQVDPRTSCDIQRADVLTGPDIGPVDLVVCSPPYPNAYSYHLYHRTRMLWLGMDQSEFKKQEIGSHRKYSRKGPEAATAETFRREMSTILDWLRKHLKPGGYACFVVGDSTLNGQVIDNATLIAGAGEQHGFRTAARLSRRMQDNKKAFNPAIGKIKHEQILILQHVG